MATQQHVCMRESVSGCGNTMSTDLPTLLVSADKMYQAEHSATKRMASTLCCFLCRSCDSLTRCSCCSAACSCSCRDSTANAPLRSIAAVAAVVDVAMDAGAAFPDSEPVDPALGNHDDDDPLLPPPSTPDIRRAPTVDDEAVAGADDAEGGGTADDNADCTNEPDSDDGA